MACDERHSFRGILVMHARFVQSLFGSFLFRVFLTEGLQHIGTAEAGIITGATPAITALLTWVMLREKLTSS